MAKTASHGSMDTDPKTGQVTIEVEDEAESKKSGRRASLLSALLCDCFPWLRSLHKSKHQTKRSEQEQQANEEVSDDGQSDGGSGSSDITPSPWEEREPSLVYLSCMPMESCRYDLVFEKSKFP